MERNAALCNGAAFRSRFWIFLENFEMECFLLRKFKIRRKIRFSTQHLCALLHEAVVVSVARMPQKFGRLSFNHYFVEFEISFPETLSEGHKIKCVPLGPKNVTPYSGFEIKLHKGPSKVTAQILLGKFPLRQRFLYFPKDESTRNLYSWFLSAQGFWSSVVSDPVRHLETRTGLGQVIGNRVKYLNRYAMRYGLDRIPRLWLTERLSCRH